VEREDRARLLWADGWQAVRLPKEVRFEDTDPVSGERCGPDSGSATRHSAGGSRIRAVSTG
jgi:hypothetical protein